ncbi:hypothetical protein TVAG_150340 [Trichomonas vaginalis G3]|uniref:Uncharacterized protein n=1 Tax=Trichomonas vaginalis (strain ATCC PRA-98 / G3) TaxID=412133 RepID=A2DRT6_TRIV3|nr:hypothetical protein TVAGG3_0978820 [Trichomonas vaginalis G3]EAY16883.1 hypothetical protein TVAG_150340 [Trichomonas vaginalis G3]KAI5489129.1 hypothetical protein TVAGG3_0978820 [Trichomonas vaginalis G3]|eukprot:XP_001329106.1 hypothetical protein [Trichomonas vaginalis G3]
MEWPLQMDFGNRVIVNGHISLSAKNNEVLITFLNQDRKTILIDSLSQLQTIEFDDADPLLMELKGQNIKRKFKLENETAVSSIWSYFQQYYRLKPAPGNHRIFSILPKTPNPNRSRGILYQAVRSNSTPLAEVKFSHTADGITNELIRESISELQIIDIDENNYDKVFSNGKVINGYSVSELDVSPAFTIELWRRILGIQEWRFEEYSKLKAQLDPVLTGKVEANVTLKKFIETSKNDLQKKIFTIEGGEGIAFNALLAFFLNNFCTDDYIPSMSHVVTLFTNCLLAGSAGEDMFYTQSGDNISADQASSIIFSLFDSYYSKTSGILSSLFDDTLQLIMLSSPSTHEMISSANLENFNFLIDEVGSLFIKGRDMENSVLLMTAGLSSPSIPQFVRTFLASSFILLHNRLAEIVEEQPSLFCDTYIRLLQTVNVRLLLHNAHLMSDFENEADK